MRLAAISLIVVLGGMVTVVGAQEQQLQEFAAACGVAEQVQPQVLLTGQSKTWRRVSAEELEKCESCAEVVRSWKSDDKTLVLLERAGIESGDWEHVVAYCYGRRGKLERVVAEFRSSWGWRAVTELRGKGKRLDPTGRKFYDLDTGQKIAPPAAAGEWEQHMDDVPAYTKVEQMPWAGWLR